jgi:beta-glucosidase
MTFNEMEVPVNAGYRAGRHAPGEKLDATPALALMKNMQLAHGRGVQALRAALPSKAQVGIAHVGPYFMPASDSPGDIEAVRQAMFEGPAPLGPDTGSNALYLDPMLLSRPAKWGAKYFRDGYPQFTEAELATLSPPLDFLGMNIYYGRWVTTGPDGNPVLVEREPEARTHFGWGVAPDTMYWGAKMLHERYGLPILVTENGMSNNDTVSADGKVHDTARIEFLKGYLRALRRAADDGVPVLGYLQWSLMDNFEWAEGYRQRFGLIHIDYETQQRTLKDSALWYRDVIASNGENL